MVVLKAAKAKLLNSSQFAWLKMTLLIIVLLGGTLIKVKFDHII
jgi:hypothetical protein